MFMQNLTEEQRLDKAVVAIMSHKKYVALAPVLMVGKRIIVDDPSVPTACTNGRDEWYGREFVKKLNDAELRFLVLHEVWHKLYKHLIIWLHLYEEDPFLANCANDFVSNLEIVDENQDGFATMTGELEKGCYDEKYRGMDSAQVYNLLRQDLPTPPPPPRGIPNDSGEDGAGANQGSETLPNGQSPFDTHDWEGAKELTPEEKRALGRELDEAIRQGTLIAGKMGSGGARDFSELLKAQVDWREALRDFISDTCTGKDYSTYRKPNRRFLSLGIYMPSGVTETVGELVLAVDTSGSIGQREITQFLSEIKSICDTVQPDGVRLLYWDTKICRDEKYDKEDLKTIVESTKPEGGGGTNVRCVTEYIRDEAINAQACIVLTDGDLYNGWGEWNMPVLWCVMDNDSKTADVGKTIHINSRDM